MNVVCYERGLLGTGLLWTWSVMNGSVMNRSVMNRSVMNRSVLKGNHFVVVCSTFFKAKGLFSYWVSARSFI